MIFTPCPQATASQGQLGLGGWGGIKIQQGPPPLPPSPLSSPTALHINQRVWVCPYFGIFSLKGSRSRAPYLPPFLYTFYFYYGTFYQSSFDPILFKVSSFQFPSSPKHNFLLPFPSSPFWISAQYPSLLVLSNLISLSKFLSISYPSLSFFESPSLL